MRDFSALAPLTGNACANQMRDFSVAWYLANDFLRPTTNLACVAFSYWELVSCSPSGLGAFVWQSLVFFGGDPER